EKLYNLLSAIKIKKSRGGIFYRARLSNKDGFPKEAMGNPPSSSAAAGRANPVGISYLYLSGDLDTTLFETRAGLYDYVSIGEFRLLEDIYVVDLKDVEC